MESLFNEEWVDFLAKTLGIAVAVITTTYVTYVYQHFTVAKAPTKPEPGHEEWRSALVNVDFIGRDDAPMELGSIDATIRNGRGGLCHFRGGAFLGCDPAYIHVGAWVTLSVQDGLWREHLKVKCDAATATYYIKSSLTQQELFETINGPAE